VKTAQKWQHCAASNAVLLTGRHMMREGTAISFRGLEACNLVTATAETAQLLELETSTSLRSPKCRKRREQPAMPEAGFKPTEFSTRGLVIPGQ
jgi:hypothetical protein